MKLSQNVHSGDLTGGGGGAPSSGGEGRGRGGRGEAHRVHGVRRGGPAGPGHLGQQVRTLHRVIHKLEVSFRELLGDICW